jgi:hypothetical protein
MMANYIINQVLLADFALLRVKTNSNKRFGNRIRPQNLRAQRPRIAFPV